ncbi:DUF2520 domain-containing protein [Microbacterium sp. bgisy189]|uniref:DUF2520 domain-containing protein n=1 Tax=Microbacterium sp. bgisy189 TaxID=3413798 RepID=UPI003EBA7B7A
MSTSSPQSTSTSTGSIALVGPGRLGRVLARALTASGCEVHGPVGRTDAVPAADVVLLCVPDEQITTAAAKARQVPGALVGHTSGATGLDDVDFGIHPLQTITGDESGDAFPGAACAVAGRTDAALQAAVLVAGMIGAHPFEIADEQRAGYHAAASLASNALVALLDAAERAADAAGVPDSRTALAPLVRRTVENWIATGAAALTGPVVRGDERTVARQRAALQDSTPDLVPLFDELTTRMRVLAAERDTR